MSFLWASFGIVAADLCLHFSSACLCCSLAFVPAYRFLWAHRFFSLSNLCFDSTFDFGFCFCESGVNMCARVCVCVCVCVCVLVRFNFCFNFAWFWIAFAASRLHVTQHVQSTGRQNVSSMEV